MNIQLIKERDLTLSPKEQIMYNRGIPLEDMDKYLNTTDEDMNSPFLFGKEPLDKAYNILTNAIVENQDVIVIVDADCDGFTSSAIMVNYLHDMNSTWAKEHVSHYLHDEKVHGLEDCYEYVLKKKPRICLIPDAGSNDYIYHEKLAEANIDIIILDHHEAPYVSKDAVVINNQLSEYPNKNLSGVGVTWQFCRYVDIRNNTDYANLYLDLVALGNVADMVSMKDFETKHLVQQGFKNNSIRNPFINGMFRKNAYSIGAKITPHGASFYIAPFVNAMVRSGSLEEKDLLFSSMLKHKAFEQILSNKRGHAIGAKESLLEQALRCVTNVKRRQKKAQDATTAYLERYIENNNLTENKVLILLGDSSMIEKNIAGLSANKLADKYQRPALVLIKNIDENGEVIYRGSARGYEKSGMSDFKDRCEKTGYTIFAAGHQNAFGIAIKAKDIENFTNAINIQLSDLSTEPTFLVDFITDGRDITPNVIFDIHSLKGLWGKDFEESFVGVKGLKVTPDMVQIFKNNTLRINIANGIGIMMFKAPQELVDTLTTTKGYIKMDMVCSADINEWNGNEYPQMFVEDYEIIQEVPYNF